MDVLTATASRANLFRLSRTAILVAAALILFLFESAIPRPLPWLKPGLSNLITVVALYLYGVRVAVAVSLLRVITGSLILGTLLNPIFLFGFGGAALSVLVMALAYTFFRHWFSVLGVSILGAFTHNLVQLLLAAVLVVNREQVLYLLPLMLLSSLFSGFLVGIFAHYIFKKATKFDVAPSEVQ
ncbi:MAG: Gx transporter family protein, partial [Calditrichaeota bacterium]